MLHKIESALFRLGLISNDYIMRRNLIESMDMDYIEVREHYFQMDHIGMIRKGLG